MTTVLDRFATYVRSRRFFSFILAFFIFESAWIALSAAYPQAFDENFHFGLIKVYSHYWLPFLSSQPPHANAYGAVARDPSYLYHYLMSFPYRFIALFVHSQIGQVIWLRFINIGFFATGLVLFRRILRRVGISMALANLSLLLFVLIPIVPQLAAQINYDNLLIPMTAAMILLTFRVIDELRAHKPSIWSITMLGSFCLLTSLVKYAFLPIFAAIGLFLLVITYRAYKGQFKHFGSLLWQSWRAQRRRAKLILVALAIVSVGLFVQRDGVNLVEYHTVQPDCSQILTVKQCSAYSPWEYNYKSHLKVESEVGTLKYTNPVSYSFEWIYWMWYRLFFAVNGPNQNFRNYPPLPLPSAAIILIGIAGVVAVIKWWRRIFAANLYLVLLFVISAFYLIALFGQGYSSYRYTDVLENMNGRYLLPILLLIAAIVGRGLSIALRRSRKQRLVFAMLALVLFLEGGGFLTFIARSDHTWDIPNNTVLKVNDVARHIINPVIINGKKSYDTRVWVFN